MTTTRETGVRLEGTGSMAQVSALVTRPPEAQCLLVYAHGAGVPMRHAFMERTAERLAARGVATFRYQFPYMERGGRRPDHRRVLVSTVRSAVAAAAEAVPDLPMLAGGKSLGGRMTSLAASEEPLACVRGLVFFGFPLHPPRKPGTDRAEHLANVGVPMLFLQGTRDDLAELGLLSPICAGLDRTVMHVVEGADHAFAVLKRSGRTHDQVMDELAQTVADWAATLG